RYGSPESVAMQTPRRASRASLLALPWTILCALASAAVPAQAQDIMPEPDLPSVEELRNRPAALITGSTNGLGREVAQALGERGWHVVVHGRDHARGLEVVEEVTAAGGTAAFYQADLASMEEVRRLAAAVARDHDRLDALVNNAGIWLTGDDERRLSADGYDLSFAVNYLAGFQLTRALLPLLRRSAPSRILNVASVAQTPIDFDDVMLEHGYSGSRAYGQSKLAQ